jgi:hypothetical protein
MCPDLFDHVSALPGRKQLDQMLFGGSQYTRQADHEEITDQMRADDSRFAAHVFLFEPGHPCADGGTAKIN